jgi:hypothetical protein
MNKNVILKQNQYPSGTELLWMAHYRKNSNEGDMNGMTVKLSGTLEEAGVKAQKIAIEYNVILQCLRRRY